jgi:TolB-like protein/class 3 adenylate cyclase
MVRQHAIQRRLAALFSADVQGYSRLMAEDEVATVRTLVAYRAVMAAYILEHGGRVVDSPGDNLLAEFASVVEAVQCAVDIQQVLTARNAALPLHRRMEFRIGINVGDVLVEDERLYGDAVNLTARIEALARAGGIYLSGAAYDQVETKFALSYAYLGEHTVKNRARPVRVYRVVQEGYASPPPEPKARRMGWRAKPWAVLVVILGVCLVLGSVVTAWRGSQPLHAAPVLTLPTKPSLVVLPFTTLSDDSRQKYMSDSVTADLTTALAKHSGLGVIARTSAFAYKGKAVTVQQMGRELGVEYIVEGSVRTMADTVRITTQLIEARTGRYLWAERYDRALTDMFALQDELILQIVQALQDQLAEVSQRACGPTTLLLGVNWPPYARLSCHF